MNIYVELNKIVDFIEDNLEEKIEYSSLAKNIGVNEYTFLRIFSVIANISIPEYIRNRRLSKAGQDLYLENEKVIDVAIKYQYGNSVAFSRAFEKFHGIKPSEVKKNPERLKLFTKLHFDEIKEMNYNIEYKIISREELTLYGKFINTNNVKIKIDAPNLYQDCLKKYGEPDYGMISYEEETRDNVKYYWILYNKKNVGFKKVIIPKSKWIQIRINSQNAKEIQKASEIFYTEFLPSCRYNLKNLPELEYYHNNITDFLVAIED